MRKFLIILVISGAFFCTNANAQGESLPYSMNTTDIIADGWSDAGTTANWNAGNTPDWLMVLFANRIIIIEKEFDLAGKTVIDISYNISISTTLYNLTYKVFIDNVLTPVNLTGNGNDFTGTIQVTNNATFTSTSMVRVEIEYLTQTTTSSGFTIVMNTFDVVEGTVGINDSDLSDNLEVFSYNKSVFISSNEYIAANITIYNLNGQIVKTENRSLTRSKSEINLNDLTVGMYILSVSNKTEHKQYKVVIK